VSTSSSKDKPTIQTIGWTLIALSFLAEPSPAKASETIYDSNSNVILALADGSYSANLAEAIKATEMEALYVENQVGATPSVGLDELAKVIGTSPKSVAEAITAAKTLGDQVLSGSTFAQNRVTIDPTVVRAITNNKAEQTAIKNYLMLRNISVSL
jgi:hypothetical protein